MAIAAPTLSVNDQEYYPLHEEDGYPHGGWMSETPPHREWVTYAYNALRARYSTWFITSNVCLYWEMGNTEKYRAPDLFVVKEPLVEPVERTYLCWQQPQVAFVMEVGSKSTRRVDEGPKVTIYQDLIQAREYLYTNPPKGEKRLWRLGPHGYEEVAPQANGRLWSEELGLEFDLVDGFPRFFTLEGDLLPSHEETSTLLEETSMMLGETSTLLEQAEERRRVAELQTAIELERRLAAEERAAELERQLAALQARQTDRGDE